MSIQFIDKLLYEVEDRVEDKMADSEIDTLAAQTEDNIIPHKDKRTWFIQCKRDEAQALLIDKPSGTFLVRPSSDGSHALSIV